MNLQKSDRGMLDRAQNGNLAVFAASGLLLASWLSRIPDVKQEMQLTTGMLSILLLAAALGALAGLPIAGRISTRLGDRNTVRISALASMVSIFVAALAIQFISGLPIPMIALFLFGFGVGVWDVVANLQGTSIEIKKGRAIMPWFHAAFSGGTIIGALIGALATHFKFPFIVHMLLAAFVTSILILWGTSGYLKMELESKPEVDSNMKPNERSAWKEPRTLLIGLMALAVAFAEGTAIDWIAVAFVDGYGTSNTEGVLGLATFLTFMTAGRIFGTRALDTYGRVITLRVLFISSVIGCFLFVFGGNTLAFVGAAFWGLGASLGFPVGMSAASDDPKRAASRISVVATIAYVAFLAGPPIIGFLGEAIGILKALLAVGVVGALAFLSVPAAKPLPQNS